MATVRRANTTAAEAAQETQDTQDIAMQETGEAELEGGVLVPYAVTAKGGLRLREEPSLDAPVVAVLPCGAGVFGDGEPGPDGWLHVFTGHLPGWMLGDRLEPLPGVISVPKSGYGDG